MDTFQEVVQGDLQAKISTAQTIHNDTSLLRARVEAQMASIEATVARALARLTAMEQPVGFTAGQYEAVENPAANTVPHMYDEIRLDFQVRFLLHTTSIIIIYLGIISLGITEETLMMI